MKIAVVGGGGREHAVIKKLKENSLITQIYALPGNGGIAMDATCVPISATDIKGVVKFAQDEAIDLVAVIPDDPLCMGMVDQLKDNGIKAFGPVKKAAIIEGSKVFSKRLMKKYGIPTAAFESFDDMQKAIDYVMKAAMPMVVKADGLALGKGVVICQTREEAVEAVRAMMEDNLFGMSGSRVVLEEFLQGPEVTVLCFTDGHCIRPMVSSMDHKRARDNDEGLNTGGMGTIAPNPYYTSEIAQVCMEKIFLPTVKAMNTEGRTFTGCLYFGLMLTPEGPKVIEYNCRFGDPETQVVLPLLESDLLEIMLATINGTLDKVDVAFSQACACCVVLASGGYPKSYQTGYPIEGLELAEKSATIYHAGTKRDNDCVLTNGGRVLGVTAVASTLDAAIENAYEAAQKIKFVDKHMRTDIGKKALEAK